MSKTYHIVKNGERIRTAKNLKDAKEVADQENGEVFCEGKSLYKAEVCESLRPTPYIITSLMNVRSSPGGEILGTASAGTVVDVYEIKDDWMRVKWREGFAFILYGNGQFAGRA